MSAPTVGEFLRPFSQENKNFTDQCHKLAQALIYPQLFGVNFDDLEFTDSSLRTTPKNTILDGQMAIDRLIKVTVAGFSTSLEFMVQERFRNPRFANYRDLTITTWNTITNLPSELYKLNAGIFIYGYANKFPQPTGFIEAVAVDTTRMLISIIKKEIYYRSKTNPRSQQEFLTINFSELYKSNCVITNFANTTLEIINPLLAF